MVLLLAMFQKFKLIRERNQLVLEQSRNSSKLSRIEKNIKNRQEYYTSIFKQIENQAKSFQNNATMALNTMAGIGVGLTNPMDYTGMGNAFITNFMNSILGEKGTGYGNKGEERKLSSGTSFKDMAEYYAANGSFKDKEGNLKFSEDDIALFNTVRNAGYQAQQQAQANVSMLSAQVQNNVSIWAEAQKEYYEAEQDAALEPLTYEQTMLELDNEHIGARLERIKNELQAYNTLAQESAQDAAPKFGLG